MDMVEIMLESLPYYSEYDSFESSIRYGADPTVYSPEKVCEFIRLAAARQHEVRSKRSGKRNNQKQAVTEPTISMENQSRELAHVSSVAARTI